MGNVQGNTALNALAPAPDATGHSPPPLRRPPPRRARRHPAWQITPDAPDMRRRSSHGTRDSRRAETMTPRDRDDELPPAMPRPPAASGPPPSRASRASWRPPRRSHDRRPQSTDPASSGSGSSSTSSAAARRCRFVRITRSSRLVRKEGFDQVSPNQGRHSRQENAPHRAT